VISLPRSQVEMTPWDQEWQDRISKVVRRVAKDLIANDETEISEVIRRRLFQDLGSEKIRKNVAYAFGDWCFERRAQLSDFSESRSLEYARITHESQRVRWHALCDPRVRHVVAPRFNSQPHRTE